MKSIIASMLLASKHSSVSASGWTYPEQLDWADSYSMCDNKDESPIDISTTTAIYDDEMCSGDFNWSLNYDHTTFKMANNGHTIVLHAVEPSIIDDDGDITGTIFDEEGNGYLTLGLNEDTIGTFPNYFQPWRSDHESFCLDSLHFHWGTTDDAGSEHLVDGEHFALEVHFVHYSCAHASLGTTLENFQTEEMVDAAELEGEDTHQLGVVGIFFDVVDNATNPAFEALFGEHDENLDSIRWPDRSEHTTIVTGLDLAELVPEDIGTAGYYAYEGSLTTPPCTNIVRWHVMNAHSYIGVEQMIKFRQLFQDAYGTQVAPNYRVVQENENTVYACMESNGTEIAEDKEEEDESVMIGAVIAYSIVVPIMGPILLAVICIYKTKRRTINAVTVIKN